MAKPVKKTFPWWLLIITLSFAVFVFLNLEDIRHRVMIASTRASIDAPVTIPFKLERGLIVLEAELDGEALEMILDSAAFETRLSADTADYLGIKASISDDVGDTFGRSSVMGIASLPAFSLGDATWQRATAGMLNWGAGALTPCVAKDGIIGGTTMRHASWVIDFEASQVHIGNPERVPASFTPELTSIPFSSSRISLSPEITVEVNAQTIETVLVDTGSNGGLVLPGSLLGNLGVPEESWIQVEDEATASIFGTTKVSSVLAPVELKLGDTEPVKVYAEFTDDSAPKLGTQVLSNYFLAIVPGERKLYLASIRRAASLLNPPLDHGFIPGISDEGEAWVVVYRERDWLESQANTVDPLAIGSEFKTINGLTPKEVFKDNCELFLGIREFIAKPQMVLARDDGSQLVLDTNTQR